MTVHDQLGRAVELEAPPRRIVSVVPSQTELLADLGLADEVVGITKFCVHPDAWFRSKARIGGTKTLKLDAIRALSPDLIVANKEENEQAQIETLAQEFPVWVSDIHDLDDALDMIRAIGDLCQRTTEAEDLISQIEQGFQGVSRQQNKKVLYLIWRRPWMAAGGDTFIHDILRRLGFFNALGQQKRYPELSDRQIQELQPEVILLSSEPYPFKEKHLAEIQALAPKACILLVDGEMFSWYGSRLALAPNYFSTVFPST